MRHNKLDRRYKGYGQFKYTVSFWLSKEYPKFCEIRNWCWTQWGPSSEVDIWERNPALQSPNWCWVKDDYKVRIYLTSDKEYQWFLLKWC
jgi:hypothetical protein